MWKSIVTMLVFVSFLSAAEISEKFAKRVTSVEEAYESAVQKADKARSEAIKKAKDDREKVLKTIQSQATKAGDFDTAIAIKAKLDAQDLAQAITEFEWNGPPNWGRFVFKADGTLHVEHAKVQRTRWVALDANSVLVITRGTIDITINRFIFNESRTKVSNHIVGTQLNPGEWEADKIAAQK